MGGSANGDNSQLVSLMSQYGGESEGPSTKQRLEKELRRQYKLDAGIGGQHLNMGSIWGAILKNGWPTDLGGDGSGSGGGAAAGIGSGVLPGRGNEGQTGAGQPLYWQFPRYTQSWAFTPPAPTPYMNPPPFDKKKYGDPLGKKNK